MSRRLWATILLQAVVIAMNFLVVLTLCALICVSSTASTSEAKTNPADSEIIFSGKTRYLVIPAECYDSLIVHKDITNIPCMKQTLSKTIGYTIMVAAAILKGKQIILALPIRMIVMCVNI